MAPEGIHAGDLDLTSTLQEKRISFSNDAFSLSAHFRIFTFTPETTVQFDPLTIEKQK